MNIAIDYDDTYTLNPEMWDRVIREFMLNNVLKDKTVCVFLVTCRRDTPENREEVHVPLIPKARHIFTGLLAKRWFCEQQGIKIDVWIDDNPESIIHGMW